MQVQRVQNNNITFGKIILRDNTRFPKSLCDFVEEKAKEHAHGGFKSESLADKRLIDEVIKYDFNTPELKETYKRLVLDQESNPVNIYLDLFSKEGEIPLHPSGWFQKATVGEGILKRTFKQATWYLDTPPSKIKFLQRACLYADILKFFRLGR